MLEDYSIKVIKGTAIPLRGNNIDTDRIIPARFLKCITFDELKGKAFFDDRFDCVDIPNNHPFNEQKFKNGSILIVNKNFGCGSSREHAPQALLRSGITAIIGESFAEIFAGNCASVGIPALTAPEFYIENIMTLVESDPQMSLEIDLVQKKVKSWNFLFEFDMPESTRSAFIQGNWDTTRQLLKNKKEIMDRMMKFPCLGW